MTAHEFNREPGGTLCLVCHCPGHCMNCDEGVKPSESHLYRNAATKRWTYGCVRIEPLRSDPDKSGRRSDNSVRPAAVHKVRPVRKRR